MSLIGWIKMKYGIDIMQEFIDDVCGLSDLYDVVHGMMNWTYLMIIGMPCLEEVVKMKYPPWGLIFRHCSVNRQFILDHCHSFGKDVIWILSTLFCIDDEIFDALSDYDKLVICNRRMSNSGVNVQKLVTYVNSHNTFLGLESTLDSEIDYVIKNIDDNQSLQYLPVFHRLHIYQLEMIWKKIRTNTMYYGSVSENMKSSYGIIIDILDFTIHVSDIDIGDNIVCQMIDWDSIVDKQSWRLILLYHRVDRSVILKHCHEFDGSALFVLKWHYDIDDEIFDSLSEIGKKNIGRLYCKNMRFDIRKCLPYLHEVRKKLSEDEIDIILDSSAVIWGRLLIETLLRQRLNIRQIQKIRHKISTCMDITRTLDATYEDILRLLNKK
jgi:hypothetical protein